MFTATDTKPSNHQLVNQDSGDVEYYSPRWLMPAVRQVLGEIDLDVASSAAANEVVKAKRFFTAEDDGLKQIWSGRVWMNHPFCRDTNEAWVAKLVGAYRSGLVKEAMCICFNQPNTAWFRPLIDFPRWNPGFRIRYWRVDDAERRAARKAAGKSPSSGAPKDSVVVYLGRNVQLFADVFLAIDDRSTIDIPYAPVRPVVRTKKRGSYG